MSSIFYPNECNVCKKTSTLRRCSRCQMISYCGEEHQKKHWKLHKDICKVISDLTRAKKLSHLFEDLRGCSLQTWADSRKEMCAKISALLGRELGQCESQMLQYPRSCFVCYDTRQNNLTNCPNCPLVSFCKQHHSSPDHDKMCSDIKFCHTLENDRFEASEAPETAKIMFESTLFSPPDFKKLPNSTMGYLNETLKSHPNLNYNLKRETSMSVYYPLTIFGAMRKLKISSSKLTIYIHLLDGGNIMQQFCEILFHLLPTLNNLTVVTDCKGQISSGEMSLCTKCTLSNKKLTFKNYNFEDKFDNFDLAIFMNLQPPNDLVWQYSSFQHLRHICNKCTCPLVLTASTELGFKRVKNYVDSFFQNPKILFDGINDFPSLAASRYWEDFRIKRNAQYLLIVEASKCLDPKENFQPTPEKIIERFYPGICHVCKSANAMVSCTRCKMIFYCGDSHMKKNQPEHKDICKVILAILSEKGTPHLFDKLQINNEKSWLEAKLNFVKQVKLRLNRDLLRYEKEMFLFPKTCFVCYESDLSVLKTCKCNVSLCKIHREDTEHKNLCNKFYFNVLWGRNKEKPQKQLVLLENQRDKNLLSSMDKFINSYFLLKTSQLKPTIQYPQKVIISDLLTRPMTLAYVIDKLQIPLQSSIYIQVVGATNEEYEHVAYWHTVFYWFKNLQSILIDFIGIELCDKNEYYPKSTFHFHDHSLMETKFTFRKFKERYEEFSRAADFRKPDIIIGYNLDLHESNLGLTECTWKPTISLISRMKVPFLLTAMTEERAKRDHEMICSLLGKQIDYEYFGKNPYVSWMPERDFQTERLCYSNNYIIVYKQFDGTKGEGEVCKLKINADSKTQTMAENSDLKTKTDVTKEELLRENLHLQKKNQILKENLRLKEENERLKSEISKLNSK